MPEVVTPNRIIRVPPDTPRVIIRALEVASSTQFCRFVSDLEATKSGEYAVEAEIGPKQAPLLGPGGPWYRVRFLIPKQFPYSSVRVVPIDPDLKWYPHQNGDWPEDVDPHANAICPPRMEDISVDELLLPYIRHAYEWISDAIKNNLTRPNEPYELPHIVPQSKNIARIYVEGGTQVYPKVRTERFGRAWLRRIKVAPQDIKVYRVVELYGAIKQAKEPVWQSNICDNAFGDEEAAGWAPWVFAGDPVIRPPHCPPIAWCDLPDRVQEDLLAAIREVSKYKNVVPVALLAFAIPSHWGGTPDRIAWASFELLDYHKEHMVGPPKGFRPNSNMRLWPAVRRFVAANNPLQWVKTCDVSRKALVSRAEGTPSIEKLSIGLLGVGAVGSVLATALARLHPRKLLLIDKELVEPGNLIRHEAVSFMVGKFKATAIARFLRPIFKDTSVSGLCVDCIDQWEEIVQHLSECNLIIDATGNAAVQELIGRSRDLESKCIAWCYIKPGPDFGVLVLRRTFSNLTLEQAMDRLRESVDPSVWAAFANDGQLHNGIVWPEPGCYHPTFAAPFHRVRLMADTFVTTILQWLERGCTEDVITMYRQEERYGQYGIETSIERQICVR